MKQTLVFAFLIFLVGCKATTKNEQPLLLQGNWVLKEFEENLETTGSLKRAYELTDFYCTEMIFNSEMDSVVVFQGQQAYSTLPLSQTDIGYKVTFKSGSPSEILFDTSDSTIFFADSVLNRVFRYRLALKSEIDASQDIPLAVPTIINNSLLKGRWEDDYGNSIVFSSLGKVNDWEKYDSYSPFYNPDVIQNKSGDLLLLKKGIDVEHLYGINFKKQELVLFDLVASSDTNFYQHGDVKFRFRLAEVQQ